MSTNKLFGPNEEPLNADLNAKISSHIHASLKEVLDKYPDVDFDDMAFLIVESTMDYLTQEV